MSVFPAASKKHVPEAFSHLMYDPVSYFLEGLVRKEFHCNIFVEIFILIISVVSPRLRKVQVRFLVVQHCYQALQDLYFF